MVGGLLGDGRIRKGAERIIHFLWIVFQGKHCFDRTVAAVQSLCRKRMIVKYTLTCNESRRETR